MAQPWALVLVVGMALCCWTACCNASLPCEDSGYCSVGVSKAWRGDIKQSSDLKAMLESVSYKQELIITTFMKQPSPPYTRADEVLQLHAELRSMGYAHFLVVVMDKEECDQLPDPTLSCVWDSDQLPYHQHSPFWQIVSLRWKVLARAIRLGYNIMGIDSDFIFWSDPYTHLKSHPFKDIHMLCNPEREGFYCNAGFVYVQNVRPDGPVAWAWMDYTRVIRRLADDNFEYISQFNHGKKAHCNEDEQNLIEMAFSTAALGRPAYFRAIDTCKHDAVLTTRANTNLTGEQAGKLLYKLVLANGDRLTQFQAKPSDHWLQRNGFHALPVPDTFMTIANLTIPNMEYGFPEELGGSLFPPGPPGPSSSAWEHTLRSDCPSCPWWNETRPLLGGRDPLDLVMGPTWDKINMNKNMIDLFVDPTIPKEMYARAPAWLVGSFQKTRRGVMLGKGAFRPGYVVMSHIHHFELNTDRVYKLMIRKIYGRYEYDVGEKVASMGNLTSPYLMGRIVKRVLMLSPEMDLSRTRTAKELAHILAGLFQLAYLSHRTLILPDLPCETSWAHAPAHVANVTLNKSLCLAPLFWQDPDVWPRSVPIAVDSFGEIIGGALDEHQRVSDEVERQAANVLQAPGQQGAGVLTSGIGANSVVDNVRMRTRRSRRSLIETPTANGKLADGWWERQRFALMPPPMWDATCTQDMLAIISPEFHHWRKHSPAAHNITFWPHAGNTVFLPHPSDPSLTISPPSPVGGDSASVPRGQVLTPSSVWGWSWHDVQLTVPVTQAMHAMRHFVHEPLVFVGHPVTIVPDRIDADATATQQQQQQGSPSEVQQPLVSTTQQQQPTGTANAQGSEHPHEHSGRHLDPQSALQRINHIVNASRCKMLWEEMRTDTGRVVPLSHGLLGEVVDRVYVGRAVAPTLVVPFIVYR